MGATSGAGNAYPSGAPKFTPGFKWGSCYSIFCFICMFCRSLFVFLYFFFWPLCCLFFFDIQILITPFFKFFLEKSKGQSKKDNSRYTRHKTNTKKPKAKHNSICVGYHYRQSHTNNAYKTWAILHKTGGKYESNIVFIRKS